MYSLFIPNGDEAYPWSYYNNNISLLSGTIWQRTVHHHKDDDDVGGITPHHHHHHHHHFHKYNFISYKCKYITHDIVCGSSYMRKLHLRVNQGCHYF